VIAALFERFGGPVKIIDVRDPAPPRDGVVVEVHASGLCRSDWHGWVGHDAAIRLPHVPGHELSGVVVGVGEGVEPTFLGQRVTAPFVLGCGACSQCLGGNQQVCEHQYQPGFSGWGSFAQYVALPYAAENIVRLPDEMSFATAAILGCRFATAFRAVVDQGGVTEGQWVSVWGCGGVGLSAVMIAAGMGAHVIALDIDEAALELAISCGAAASVLVQKEDDSVEAVKDLSSGGVAVSLDTLGSSETAVNSIRSLATRGRHVQVGLMVGEDAEPTIPVWRLHANEVELYGSHGMQAWRYPSMLKMIEDGRLDPAMLVTETFDLAGGVERFREMERFPGTGIAVITDFSSSEI